MLSKQPRRRQSLRFFLAIMVAVMDVASASGQNTLRIVALYQQANGGDTAAAGAGAAARRTSDENGSSNNPSFPFAPDVAAFSPVTSLTIRGSGLGLDWQKGIPMKESPPGTFTAELDFNGSDVGNVLEFKTLAEDDSVWQLGSNSLTIVGPGTATIYPWFYQPVGQFAVVERDVPCKYFDNTRDVVLYLPAPALENVHPGTRWETLVMHDGENVFNDSTSFGGRSWRASETIDALVGKGTMRPIAVVAPYNSASRIAEYTPVPDPEYGGGQGDHYLDWLTSTLLPLVAPRFQLSTDRDDLGLLGSSLGGLISCYAGWTRSGVYGRVGCMSSSFWWDSQYFNNTLLVDHAPPPAKDAPVFYLDSGDQPAPDGDDELETIGVRDHLVRLGWSLGETVFYELQHGGAHNEASWGERFYLPMQQLYPPRPTPVEAADQRNRQF